MTLDEAIYREEALAYSYGERYKRGGEPVGDLPKIEEEHRQLEKWLKELKAYKNANEDIIKICVDYCEYPDHKDVMCRACSIGQVKDILENRLEEV